MSKGFTSLQQYFSHFEMKGEEKSSPVTDVSVETTCPDIIVGTKTWLSDDIPSTYFFDQALGFTVHRNDRASDHMGEYSWH